MPELPEALKTTAYRQSLTEEQNKAVDLAAKLGQCIDNGDGTVIAAPPAGDDGEEARVRIKKKVRSIARMARMFKTLRQENETVIRLKGVCPGHKLSPGLLLAGKDKLQSELDTFNHVRDIDTENEIRPDQAGVVTAARERDFIDDETPEADAKE